MHFAQGSFKRFNREQNGRNDMKAPKMKVLSPLNLHNRFVQYCPSVSYVTVVVLYLSRSSKECLSKRHS